MRALVGVIVPAWNEEKVLAGTLQSLLAQQDVVLDVIIAANGCDDATAKVGFSHLETFRRAGHRLRIVEISRASKTAALRAAEDQLDTYPRAYIDADVMLSSTALKLVAEALDQPSPRLSAPKMRLKSRGAWLENQVAALMENLPPHSSDVVGGGFYAVNRAGRARWGTFPDFIADDSYVVGRFIASERIQVAEAYFRPRFPTAKRLLPIFVRWEAGLMELAAQGLAPPRVTGRALVAVAVRPKLWIGAVIFAGLKVCARVLARWKLAQGRIEWHRADDQS